MAKPKILIQIDSDAHASTFDSVVAVDSGVDHLLSHSAVSSMEIRSLVHGAMFTRGGDDLKNTALFFGGSDVRRTESLVRAAKKSFFGPVRVSLMSDPNGSNTTAAAAIIAAEKHIDLSGKVVTVLAATGPVGIRLVQLAARLGATVRVCSRELNRAKEIMDDVCKSTDIASETLVPFETGTPDETLASLQGADVLFSAGAAGVQMVNDQWLKLDKGPSVAIDLNAVPPVGIHSIEVMDKAVEREAVVCYGAIGVGGLKMKIHRHCIQRLFESNDLVLEIQEIYEVGKQLGI